MTREPACTAPSETGAVLAGSVFVIRVKRRTQCLQCRADCVYVVRVVAVIDRWRRATVGATRQGNRTDDTRRQTYICTAFVPFFVLSILLSPGAYILCGANNKRCSNSDFGLRFCLLDGSLFYFFLYRRLQARCLPRYGGAVLHPPCIDPKASVPSNLEDLRSGAP